MNIKVNMLNTLTLCPSFSVFRNITRSFNRNRQEVLRKVLKAPFLTDPDLATDFCFFFLCV